MNPNTAVPRTRWNSSSRCRLNKYLTDLIRLKFSHRSAFIKIPLRTTSKSITTQDVISALQVSRLGNIFFAGGVCQVLVPIFSDSYYVIKTTN
mmetsp:Transcript_5816/g.19054  ORF Transcript_5816/g.19054 Transcript_5816/m.19054 type:complete len:93 (-) Transcript_5816:13-291(-)